MHKPSESSTDPNSRLPPTHKNPQFRNPKHQQDPDNMETTANRRAKFSFKTQTRDTKINEISNKSRHRKSKKIIYLKSANIYENNDSQQKASIFVHLELIIRNQTKGI